MGRYTGPKGRVNRRLGTMVFENAGAVKALERRNSPPGMAERRRKLSTYGEALADKQRIKYYYGIREAQLRKYFATAKAKKGNTGDILMVMCESRLDNAVRRAGFTVTRLQARQGIVHRHFQLNGKTVDKPSMVVHPGDIISLRKRPNLRKMYAEIVESGSRQPCDWIQFDAKDLEARVMAAPTAADVSLPIEVGRVVAFMSR
ncbi:MAG: 30S ribosomal protein S4 [Planctomycetales bacterium 12-60-4]|nr:MAG: 30S ribosomal protein S4 [Planctomycetales bacterium 12-60-4]